MSVKKTGDWAKARKTTSQLPKNVEISEQRVLGDFMQKMENSAKRHIVADDLGWKSLAAYTIRKKGNDVKLIETGKYIQNIASWRQGKVAYVGVKDGIMYGKVSLGEVARRQEEGTSWIPERPLWKPTAQELFEEMRAGHNNAAQILDDLIRNGRT
jgi:hypothetical protein